MEDKKELTFLLERGEKIIKDYPKISYSGVAYISQGFGTGIGGSLHDTGLGTGLFSSKQIKREGSLFDAKTTHLYLTNKRLVFCDAKWSLWDNKEKTIGSMVVEIPYRIIKGINASLKLGLEAVDLSILGTNGIDNIKFWIADRSEDKKKERNEIIELIKKQLK